MLKKSLLSGVMAVAVSASAGVSSLNGEFRNGQLFLRWSESDLAPDTRLSVWSSAEPISGKNLKSAKKIAKMLNINSARDWHLDIDSFVVKRSRKLKSEEIFAGNVAEKGVKKSASRGFIIRDNGKPISPDGGLHVHTPKAGETGSRYYAVTTHKGSSDEITGIAVTAKPVTVSTGKASPIAISGKWQKGCAQNMPLLITLHGRGGGVAVDRSGRPLGTHVIFVDSSLAWREGIPFKFVAIKHKDYLEIRLFDRVWIGRKLTRKESGDSRDYVPAISTFWCGYNPNIAYSNTGPEFRFDNYTERYILHIIRWAQEFLGCDRNRTYITGGSMGGTGTIQMATRFPEVFAAGAAYVPIYSFTWRKPARGGTSMARLTCSTGFFTKNNPARLPDGTNLEDFASGARNISRPAIDMPPLIATNGRKDASIPWENNPEFYRAANRARQMFSVYWNDGNHGMTGQAPFDCRDLKQIFRYKLNESFPAFSNRSDNGNYGNGDPADGDISGWINRGCQWQNIVDTKTRYEISLAVTYPGIKYPVSCDITIRRRQNFLPAAGSTVAVSVNGKKQQIIIDKNNLLTIRNITFADGKPVKIICVK
ncbi:MAG: prolyl oligopeptidase family serine peptidase [Lentisphaeria bacterium]|nr:prolyl oligopeptidase family serine peptidase [Lentisphaeria bacterium]